MKKIISLGVVFGSMPMLALAADGVNAFSILGNIARLLGYAIPVLITLAVVYFIWGVIQFTLSSDEEAKKNARSKIINGLIGLFVIVAFWGILSLITNTFGVGPEQLRQEDIPCIPNPDAGIYCY
ncbi:MAG TPA: pilin [Candidatus Paceibacterota bacterium]|nr:pilin [Candidatus Paceibacterota bacterium]